MSDRVVATGSEAPGIATATDAKASGIVVHLEPKEFVSLIGRDSNNLVIVARAGIRRRKYQYLAWYKGIVFVAESNFPLHFPKTVEVINANRMWVPR
jgi:hypothetical protein